MKCPVCGEHTRDSWQFLEIPNLLSPDARTSSLGGTPIISEVSIEPTYPISLHDSWRSTVSVDFMHCANAACGELVMRVHESSQTFQGGVPITNTETWLVRPRWANSVRHVDLKVPEAMRKDFQEAAAILDLSPKMSAVMSRRILDDLLEEYAGRDEHFLGQKLENFAKDSRFPLPVRENAKALNEVAKLGAHTKKNEQEEIIDVDRDEAAWTLELVERFFEILIVAPARDAKMVKQIEAKRDSIARPEKRKKS